LALEILKQVVLAVDALQQLLDFLVVVADLESRGLLELQVAALVLQELGLNVPELGEFLVRLLLLGILEVVELLEGEPEFLDLGVPVLEFLLLVL
jgi:hypothetical protein